VRAAQGSQAKIIQGYCAIFVSYSEAIGSSERGCFTEKIDTHAKRTFEHC
jgi:hypothetical protein